MVMPPPPKKKLALFGRRGCIIFISYEHVAFCALYIIQQSNTGEFSLPKVFCGPQICQICVDSWGSAPDPARGAHDAPLDPKSAGRRIPLPIPHSTRRRRFVPPNVKSWLRAWISSSLITSKCCACSQGNVQVGARVRGRNVGIPTATAGFVTTVKH